MTETTDFQPCAKWSDDCQGKKDYDGHFLSISTRYWPGPENGGALAFDSATLSFSRVPYGPRPSATASIHLNFGEPDEPDGYADYEDLIEQTFEADTEEEVKAQVEQWVKETCTRILAAVRHELAVTR